MHWVDALQLRQPTNFASASTPSKSLNLMFFGSAGYFA